MKTGIEQIAEERKRQIEKEGWSLEHDKMYKDEEMIHAAVCYCHSSVNCRYYPDDPRNEVPISWPWSDTWWKPTGDPVKDLVKAGALLAAEIDRLQNL